MDWFKWTTAGWQRLSMALRGSGRDYETAEMARLVGGVEQLQRIDSAQSTPIIEAANDDPCACCGGKRCLPWRESRHTTGCGGHRAEDKCWRSDESGLRLDGCGGEGEPIPMGTSFLQLMDATLVTPGRHTVQYVLEHWVPWRWNPIPLRTRVRLWPTAYARKLGRPVQIGMMRMAMP